MLIIPFGSRRVVNNYVEAPSGVLRRVCDGFGNLNFISCSFTQLQSAQYLWSCLHCSVNGPHVSPDPQTHQQPKYLVCNINKGACAATKVFGSEKYIDLLYWLTIKPVVLVVYCSLSTLTFLRWCTLDANHIGSVLYSLSDMKLYVRIALKSWIYVCFSSVLVFYYAGRRLATGMSPVQVMLQNVYS